MSYVVDAPLVLARDQEGRVHHRYQGAVIDWLSDEQAEHFLGLGLVHKVGDEPAADPSEPDSADAGNGGDLGSADSADSGKPASDATNKVLVAWLVDNAVKEDGSDYTQSELKPLNKAALWELINAIEDEPDSEGDDSDDGSGDGSED